MQTTATQTALVGNIATNVLVLHAVAKRTKQSFGNTESLQIQNNINPLPNAKAEM